MWMNALSVILKHYIITKSKFLCRRGCKSKKRCVAKAEAAHFFVVQELFVFGCLLALLRIEHI